MRRSVENKKEAQCPSETASNSHLKELLTRTAEPVRREITEEIEDLIALADEMTERSWIQFVFL